MFSLNSLCARLYILIRLFVCVFRALVGHSFHRCVCVCVYGCVCVSEFVCFTVGVFVREACKDLYVQTGVFCSSFSMCFIVYVHVCVFI